MFGHFVFINILQWNRRNNDFEWTRLLFSTFDAMNYWLDCAFALFFFLISFGANYFFLNSFSIRFQYDNWNRWLFRVAIDKHQLCNPFVCWRIQSMSMTLGHFVLIQSQRYHQILTQFMQTDQLGARRFLVLCFEHFNIAIMRWMVDGEWWMAVIQDESGHRWLTMGVNGIFVFFARYVCVAMWKVMWLVEKAFEGLFKRKKKPS